MRYHTVLFDLDGTLLDHFGAIHASHAYTLKQLGLPAPTMAQVHRAVGGGFEVAVKRMLGPENEHLLTRALEIYREAWSKNMFNGVTLLPGARGLLEALKAQNVSCGVFTNKHGPSARDVCQHLGVMPLLDGVFGAFDTPWLKPDPEFAAHALAELKATAKTTCLIGDSPYDVEAAINGGFVCYGVTTGTHNTDQLRAAGAAGVYDDLIELAKAAFGIELPTEA
ncbi:MAG: HAD family hydrolase [Verrucomicrobia bacterium]|nr:HAD family hydrolase [Verrucomicrobiota bacterium]